MPDNIGFTQLGKRVSALEKRDTGKKSLITFVIINKNSEHFSINNIQEANNVLFQNDCPGEVLFIDLEPNKTRNELILKEFPEVRLIIPTTCIEYSRCVYLGISEAISSYVVVFESSARIKRIDILNVFEKFKEKQLFAMGFQLLDQDGKNIPSVVKAFFDRGRIHMIEGDRDFSANTLLLKNYIGIYDREKVMLLGNSDTTLDNTWGAIDFFYSAWARGWKSVVEPYNQIILKTSPDSVIVNKGFFTKLKYYRNEIRFLRKNFLDKESKLYRKRFLYLFSLKRLLRLDFSLFIACTIEFYCSLIPWKRVKKRKDSVHTPFEIFNQLMETQK